MTLKELEVKIMQAGIVMSRRQIMRHCKAGTFDAQKLPAVNNVEEWFIAPGSVDKGIADIRTLQALRSRRDATGRDVSETTSLDKARNWQGLRVVLERLRNPRDAARQSAEHMHFWIRLFYLLGAAEVFDGSTLEYVSLSEALSCPAPALRSPKGKHHAGR
jgi:hypothetical protein